MKMLAGLTVLVLLAAPYGGAEAAKLRVPSVSKLPAKIGSVPRPKLPSVPARILPTRYAPPLRLKLQAPRVSGLAAAKRVVGTAVDSAAITARRGVPQLASALGARAVRAIPAPGGFARGARSLDGASVKRLFPRIAKLSRKPPAIAPRVKSTLSFGRDVTAGIVFAAAIQQALPPFLSAVTPDDGPGGSVDPTRKGDP